MPDAIGEFRRDHPDVRMSLEIREPADCARLLRDGAIDLAVVLESHPTHGLPPLDPDGLRVEHLVDDVMHVAMPAEHPLARADETGVDVAALRHEPWIRDDGPLCSEQLVRMCAVAGYEPRIAFDSDDYAAVGRLVASGVGVALIPGLAADQMIGGVVLRATRPAVVRRVSAVVGVPAPPAAEAMLGVLARTTGQGRALSEAEVVAISEAEIIAGVTAGEGRA